VELNQKSPAEQLFLEVIRLRRYR